MSEYGRTLREAYWRFPLVAAHLLLPARAERNGTFKGATDIQEKVMDARNKAMKFLKENFEIKPGEHPWQLT